MIKGTRVPVEVIPGALAGGMEISEVCREYELEPEDVLACLEYAREAIAGEEIQVLTAGIGDTIFRRRRFSDINSRCLRTP